jgi:hypothetical protein
MTSYFDHAFDSDDVNAFLPILASEPNVIGPLPGSSEVPGADPARFYLKVRALAPVATPVGAVMTDPAVADALLGVWA